jgi:hypothetical protein
VHVDDPIRAEAVDVLEWTLRLRLSASGWNDVDRCLHRLREALSHNDTAALRTEIANLDSLGSRVQRRLGEQADPNVGPIPAPQRDLAVELVHELRRRSSRPDHA